MTSRVAAALARAAHLGSHPWAAPTPSSPTPRPRRFAIGDPQASAESFFAVLEHHGLLADDGRLTADTFLVSIGDHFDYGGTDVRAEAIESGQQILSWLADHPADQVAMLLGNHDLGRVGELAGFDADTFDAVHQRAIEVYRGGDVDEVGEAALLAQHPALPTAELAARDFAAFSPAQRELVTALLRAGRLRAAVAIDHRTLACHAGVTSDYLHALELDETRWSDAEAVASVLNARLDDAVAGWSAGRLDIADLHRSGSRDDGEGVGMFYHRPANPDVEANAGYELTATLGRRFDPRRLPRGLTQIIGHISDSKCRKLLGGWVAGEPASVGSPRHLATDGNRVRYAGGLPDALAADHATMIFIDGGMSRIPTTSYQLLDLDELRLAGSENAP